MAFGIAVMWPHIGQRNCNFYSKLQITVKLPHIKIQNGQISQSIPFFQALSQHQISCFPPKLRNWLDCGSYALTLIYIIPLANQNLVTEGVYGWCILGHAHSLKSAKVIWAKDIKIWHVVFWIIVTSPKQIFGLDVTKPIVDFVWVLAMS